MSHVKSATEEMLPLCVAIADASGDRPMGATERDRIAGTVTDLAARGLRPLAVAERPLPVGVTPERREDAERDLTLLGIVAMFDPPRPEVADVVARCHTAGSASS